VSQNHQCHCSDFTQSRNIIRLRTETTQSGVK
jgi:hypothetical protein